jgi:hypothetical protein
VYQVSVDWARGSRKRPSLGTDTEAQRELQRCIAVILTYHGDDSDDMACTVVGQRLSVSMRKFDGSAVQAFEFSKNRRVLAVSPWVYRFTIH